MTSHTQWRCSGDFYPTAAKTAAELTTFDNHAERTLLQEFLRRRRDSSDKDPRAGMRFILLVAAHGLVPSIRKAPLRYRATAADLEYMREALDLAQTVTADTTAPNPQVGCVLVQNNEIVGRGFHPKAGEPHAEIFALRDAGATVEREGDADHWSVASPLKNATAYVTLEPCSHVGKTPPCCDALVAAGCGRVVIVSWYAFAFDTVGMIFWIM